MAERLLAAAFRDGNRLPGWLRTRGDSPSRPRPARGRPFGCSAHRCATTRKHCRPAELLARQCPLEGFGRACARMSCSREAGARTRCHEGPRQPGPGQPREWASRLSLQERLDPCSLERHIRKGTQGAGAPGSPPGGGVDAEARYSPGSRNGSSRTKHTALPLSSPSMRPRRTSWVVSRETSA